MKRTKIFMLLIVVLLIFAMSFISTTLAKYIREENSATFKLSVEAYGEIKLSLTEGQDGSKLWNAADHNLAIIPGVTIPFNPYVRVEAGSEAAYLFVEIERTGSGDYEFDELISLVKADGWDELDSAAGEVYYRVINKSDADRYYQIVSGDIVTFSDEITEEVLSEIAGNYPKVNITAYAVQKTELEGQLGAKAETPEAAWEYLGAN